MYVFTGICGTFRRNSNTGNFKIKNGKTDVIIVGQGLAGTWLSWWLHKSGVSFKVVDRKNPDSASLRAAGLINPVTGRRMVTTWMSDELMAFAKKSYSEIGRFLNNSFFSETSVVDLFPSVQMLQAFKKKYDEDHQWLSPGDDPGKYRNYFNYDFGWGAIQPCYLVFVEKLMNEWRGWLSGKNLLVESEFDTLELKRTKAGVEYKELRADHIIYCDGISSASNAFFDKLPFALNKGEGMLVEIKDLPENLIFKKGMSLIPFDKGIYWLGSSYEWEFKDGMPSENFKKGAITWLDQTLKLPYRIIEHFASIRPATLERRPFVGFHPRFPSIGILNGFGTKGCSLAPYFANELCERIVRSGNINPLPTLTDFK